jgi:hypothetical protein
MDKETLQKIASKAAADLDLKTNLVSAEAPQNTGDSEEWSMVVQFWLPNGEVVKLKVRVDATPELIQEEIKRKLKEKLGLK